MNDEQIIIYTIGHGRHAIEYFLELLGRHRINMVCDVRSVARSRWPQYNGKQLAAHLAASGIGYEHLPECGGKLIAPAEELRRGLDRIIELGSDARVAIMCSESQPVTTHLKTPRANCHRVGLLSGPLAERGARIIHILPGGETLEIDESRLPSAW
jgi:uncharacterized protein (DUF488 family)